MARRLRYGAIWLLVYLSSAIFAGSVRATPPSRPLVWALGDSLTAGYGLPPAQGFTAQLQGALRQAGIPATVRNGGISGDTTAQGRARLLWGLRGLGTTPDLVIVELGANDMLRGLPPQAAEGNLDAILAELKRRRIPVLLAGMRAAPNLGTSYRQAFDSMYPRLARKYGISLYPFFLAGVTGERDLLQPDGLHPNARGVRVMVRNILPYVKRAVDQPRAVPPNR
jgi:acyl-CoA thioesterase I